MRSAPSTDHLVTPTRQRFVINALTWMVTNLDQFDPNIPGTTAAAATYPELALTELALLCRCLRRAPRPTDDVTALVDQCASRAVQIFDGGTLLDQLDPADVLFAQHILLLGLLQSCGRQIKSAERRAVQSLIDESNLHVPTRPPHAMLEVFYALGISQFRHRLPPMHSLSRHCALSEDINPFCLSDFESYAITHTVFYLTDFAANPLPGQLTARLDRITWLVEQLLEVMIHRGNVDLVAELLISAKAVGMASGTVVSSALRRVVDAQLSSGAVPGSRYQQRAADALPADPARTSYVFKRSYHTTLVSVLAMNLWADVADR